MESDILSAEYKDLHAMIFQNADARQFYNELPKSVREKLNLSAENLTSFENHKEYIKNIDDSEVS